MAGYTDPLRVHVETRQTLARIVRLQDRIFSTFVAAHRESVETSFTTYVTRVAISVESVHVETFSAFTLFVDSQRGMVFAACTC